MGILTNAVRNAGGSAVEVTFLGSHTATSGRTISSTASAFDAGTGSHLIAVMALSTEGDTPTNATGNLIAGSAPTIAQNVDHPAGGGFRLMTRAMYRNGVSGTFGVTVKWGDAPKLTRFGVWKISGVTSATPVQSRTATGASAASLTSLAVANTAAAAVQIYMVAKNVNGATWSSPEYSWSSATEANESSDNNRIAVSHASKTGVDATHSETASWTPTGSEPVIINSLGWN